MFENEDHPARPNDSAHLVKKRRPLIRRHVMHDTDGKGRIKLSRLVRKPVTVIDIIVDIRIGSSGHGQELGRDLIDVLQAEAKGTDKGAAPTERSRIYPEGGAATLKTFEDQFITQAVLNAAVPVDEARAQLHKLIDLLSKTGGVTLETTYAPKEFHADLRLRFTK